MKFGSLDYLGKIKEVVNGDEEHRKLAKVDTNSYLLVVEPDLKNNVHERQIFGYQMENGSVTEVWLGERKTDFVLTSKYGVWVDLVTGKLGLTKAIAMRKLKARGNFIKLVTGSDSVIRFMKLLSFIPTEFEGNYSSKNIVG